MKIAYVTTDYNWDSFSTLRCGFETLKNMGVDTDIFFQKDPNIFEYDQIWLMSTTHYLTYEEYKNTTSKVISFGLSEPTRMCGPEKRNNCDVYCTNDLATSKKLGCYWFPTSCDKRYHKKLNLSKTSDVVFIGQATHPATKNRVQIIEQLRAEDMKVKVFGPRWPEHPDNYGAISGDVLIEEINKSRLMLDIAREDSSLTRRIFEGLCCGTAVLTYDRADVRELFEIGVEILGCSSNRNLIEKVKLITNNHQLLEQVGQKGRERCLKEHDITHRIEALLQYLRTLGINT